MPIHKDTQSNCEHRMNRQLEATAIDLDSVR
jgi:hypothetical protein